MKKSLLLLLVFVCSYTLVSGQEVLSNLHTNPLLRKGPPLVVRHSRAVAADTLHLPFNDDFSNKSNYPDTSKWLDNYVFINNTFPINKLSYGVATFDGLNQFGVAWNDSLTGVAGSADTLTSKLIDLSSFQVGDSVYLSFSYQAKGLGDFPDFGDSLILEFSTANTDTTWVKIWGADGFGSPYDVDSLFQNVSIAIDTLSNAQFFLRNDFQFRFRNIATLSGNNDHWHIDYVYMNNTRSALDTFHNDLTFIDAPGSFLRNYTSMPWSHFYNYQSKELGDSLRFCLVNYFNAPLSPTIQFDVTEKRSGINIPTAPFSGGFTLNSYETRCFDQQVSAFAPITFAPADTDSVVISPRVFVTPTPGDLYYPNDTVFTDVNFYNYLAYDDGSAEKAYGLAGIGGLKKFAYAFHLNHPDTLRAVLIHFTSIDFIPAKLLFSFYVWKNIGFGSGTTDDTLYHEDFRTPMYVDSLNGFATIKLKTPIVISDSFYVGFTQTTDQNIEIGYDLNNNAAKHMYYNVNNTWYQSQFSGALMIRPLIGKTVPLQDTYINEINADENSLEVYPNPAANLVYTNFRTEKEGTYTEVYDLSGHLVMKQAYNNLPVDISNLQSGFYLLRYSRNGQLIAGAGKFIKM